MTHPTPDPPVRLVPLATIDPAAVEALLDAAFGAGRHARTAYAVRGDAPPIPALSVAAIDGDGLAGSIQCWPVELAADDGRRVPLVMVGPVAVRPGRQGEGIGRRLVEAALAAAAAEGLDRRLMLIGDPGYYARFFGFGAEATGGWRLPGPVERHRLLARGSEIPAVPGVLRQGGRA